jgi:predicted nucleic acid-binding protein
MMYVLDTCVLFPTVVRNILLKLALSGEFKPVWSKNIMEEWMWSSKKNGLISTESARVEIIQTKLRFPNAMWNLEDTSTEEYWLPDIDDIHVLALAIKSKSKGIITFNKKDFPNTIIGKYDLFSVTPDQFILEIFKENSNLISKICHFELDEINKTFEKQLSIKSLLKKAQLPKLAKAIS